MNDIISRQVEIDAFMTATADGDKAEWCEWVLKQVPSAQQWIPCSNRMPEKPGKYLVTVKNGNVYAGTFDVISGKFQCAATAWMPLPEPYREEV